MSDTIFALSSAPGRAGVAVIRVSGAKTRDCIVSLTNLGMPHPRMATLRRLEDPSGKEIDQALILWFPAPSSFSGEDIAEFHIHGGRGTVGKLLSTLGKIAGCRPAEPGEFTRRAVENGKLDLTQAEALIDLIDADTDTQRQQALQQYGGALAELYEAWRARLIRSLAWIEAEIDFSDEEIPTDVIARSRQEVSEICKQIQIHTDDSRRGEIIRDGVSLAVIGPANAGKSSLINALAQRDVSIVADTVGTTRDIVEVHLDLGGYAVTVADTAGLRETADVVESEGIRRALQRAQASDLTLLLLDSSDGDSLSGLPEGLEKQASLVVWNKIDLDSTCRHEGLKLSLKTGEGFDDLLRAIGQKVSEMLDSAKEAPLLTRARHRHALEQSLAALQRALGASQAELAAEDVRLALRWIGRITGSVDVEELLDVVFRDFCIGK